LRGVGVEDGGMGKGEMGVFKDRKGFGFLVYFVTVEQERKFV